MRSGRSEEAGLAEGAGWPYVSRFASPASW